MLKQLAVKNLMAAMSVLYLLEQILQIQRGRKSSVNISNSFINIPKKGKRAKLTRRQISMVGQR